MIYFNKEKEAMGTKKTQLSKPLRYFYGVGDMGFNLMSSVYTYYLVFYLNTVAKLSLPYVTLLMAISSTFDSLSSWIYGAVINSTKPMKWGRYRSWLIATSWLLPFTSFFMYFRIGGTDSVAFVFFLIAQLAARIVQNFSYTANVSLISVVAQNADERIAMSSSRATWNNAAKFAWSYLGVPFLAVLAAVVGEEYSYATLAGILGLTTFIGYFVHFRLTKGYEATGEEERANVALAKRSRTSIRDLFKTLFTNPPLLALVVADLAKWLFNFVVAGTVVYYFTYIALNKGLQATYTLIIAFMAVFGALASSYIGKKLSGRTTMIVFYLAMAALLVFARTMYTNVWAVIILVSLAQFGYGCIYSCSSALYADTAVYAEWKTGKNASGWIMGLTNVPIKIASALKSVVLPAALALSGFSAAVAVEETTDVMRNGIANTLLVLPAAMLIVGAVVLIFLYRLPKSKVEQMKQEIDAKKAQGDDAE